ncbi:MAG TPA: hypothetical protein VG944_14380 [Fimbriimonas sp.]|nr:hypothetical protein [Fimbriimonas sp.]
MYIIQLFQEERLVRVKFLGNVSAPEIVKFEADTLPMIDGFQHPPFRLEIDSSRAVLAGVDAQQELIRVKEHCLDEWTAGNFQLA